MNNDFKKNYKNEMDKVMPSQESLDALENAMTEKKTVRFTPKALRRVIAVAACVAILVGAAIPTALHFRGDTTHPDGLSPIDLIKPQTGINQVNLSDYDKIYDVISEVMTNNRGKDYYYVTKGEVLDGATDIMMPVPENTTTSGVITPETMAPTAPNAPMENEASTSTPEFSDTNLQEVGVQEADIIKTDGKYIYAISNNYLHIVKAENGELSLISRISVRASDDDSAPHAIQEMYIAGDKLIAVKSIWKQTEALIQYPIDTRGDYFYSVPETKESFDTIPVKPSIETAPETTPPYIPDGMAVDTMIDIDGNNAPDYVVGVPRMTWSYEGYGADIYDISDKSAPKLVNTLTQDGNYVSSRMIGDTLYLITNKDIYGKISASDPATFIPLVDGSLLVPESIYIAKDTAEISNSNYLIVSGIDTAGEGRIVSTKSLFGFGSNVYCSKDNLYVTSYTSRTTDNVQSNATKIFKFSLDAGKVDFVAEGTVPGTVLNQFSLDEENGYLRMVTTFQSRKREEVKNGEYVYMTQTEFKKCNCLYVLDSDLSVVGKLEDLAPDEQIYSARFEGDIAYFVTFRQTDPLFTVDLSDPTAPKILSELKIPGFSEYLHPWSDDLLFGFGKYANEITGRAGDLKLSMFDVSDKTDVTEAHTLTLTGNSYSAASYNHKAILINAQKNIIAFPTDNNRYLVYSYDEKDGFAKEAEISLIDKIGAYNYYSELRGLFIGDYLYVFSPVGIASYDMTNYTFKASVIFER